MSGHESSIFGTRTGPFIPYPGVRQIGDTCVFASVAGAVNYLSGQPIWTLESLFRACRVTQPTFGPVASVAVAPVAERVEYREHLDESRSEPVGNFLQVLRDHVGGGGIAIVSVELAAPDPTGPKRQGRWHMLTLVARQGELYQVWDSMGIQAFVTEPELTRLDYPGGALYVEHDTHHALLLRRK